VLAEEPEQSMEQLEGTRVVQTTSLHSSATAPAPTQCVLLDASALDFSASSHHDDGAAPMQSGMAHSNGSPSSGSPLARKRAKRQSYGELTVLAEEPEQSADQSEGLQGATLLHSSATTPIPTQCVLLNPSAGECTPATLESDDSQKKHEAWKALGMAYSM